MTLFRHALRLIVREPRRSLAAIVGVVIASALTTSVLLFGAASGSTVTRRALADLPVDGQVVLTGPAHSAGSEAILNVDPAVKTVSLFDLAHFESAATNKAGTATQTSTGVLLGIDPSYTAATGLFALSSGTVAPGQIVISRDLASNLGAVPGDTIAFALPGAASVRLQVSGIVSIVGADLVLGPIDAAHRAAGANPPVNVAVIGRADLEAMVLPKIPATATATDPSSAGSNPAGLPVFAAEPAVRRELHVQLDHAQLPGDPIAAQTWLDTVRRRIEREGAGSFLWVDDAGASLEPLAADLAWGQILFIFLALPGILLALALSRLAADATADTTRRHAALLRARGATGRRLFKVFAGATLLVALGGSALGVAIGAVVGVTLSGTDLASAGLSAALLGGGIVSVGLTTLLATTAAILPLRAQLAEEVASGRQELQQSRAPLWQRLFLDILAIGAGAVVYVLVGRSGIHPVLNAEGNPTVTLALTSFLAPLLFWVGGTLLLLRATSWSLRRSGRIAKVLGCLLGPGGDLAGRSLVARATAASRAIVVLALAVGFATSVLIFDATYRQQQRVDAQLSLGADLKATPSQSATASAVKQLAGPGVARATPFVDRVVYVGPEAQDLLAIDAAALPAVAPLADSFFAGSTAADAMNALRARPDAILVSAETAKDYSIVPGDKILVRVPDATGTLQTVTFTMAGIALEFPTAPKDAFLVANLSYVAAQTGNDGITFVLARADGDINAASARLARRLGGTWQVTDLGATTARLANSITSVDLSSLVSLDIAFAVLIAGVGVALFLLAGLAERRRELATLIAIGAEPGQVRASMIGEAFFIGAAGIVTGLLTGGLVGMALLQVLAGVFDPPADSPAVPLALIGAMTTTIVAVTYAALLVADRGLSRLSVVAALREQ
ncbi:MAG: ABC transporter permease [Chloroflexi bacterium]|nr:ABC transporter permease [Chloroflexota bacterium]